MATIKSIEEKAKAYDEALKEAVIAHKDEDRNLKATLERIFPELKESEDERIMGNIIAAIHLYYGEPLEDEAKEMIAWLERQGEQKPAWSEEDEVGLGDAMWAIEQARTIAKDENDIGNLWCAERWLKSLKDRYTWKPTKEQLTELRCVISGCSYDIEPLVELEKELKAL